jgi:hypothetical protein
MTVVCTGVSCTAKEKEGTFSVIYYTMYLILILNDYCTKGLSTLDKPVNTRDSGSHPPDQKLVALTNG